MSCFSDSSYGMITRLFRLISFGESSSLLLDLLCSSLFLMSERVPLARFLQNDEGAIAICQLEMHLPPIPPAANLINANPGKSASWRSKRREEGKKKEQDLHDFCLLRATGRPRSSTSESENAGPASRVRISAEIPNEWRLLDRHHNGRM